MDTQKLADYSGQFRADLKPGDFRPEVVAKLVDLYSKIFVRVDGFWYLAVKERVGNKDALACDIRVWSRLCKYEMEKITEQLNIRGHDVTALMKAIQMIPWLQQIEHRIECESQNSATLTITECVTLASLEKEGEGRENEICNIVEPRIFKCYAEFFNPDIEIECLKSPPRTDKNGICCRWRFHLRGE
ncbi:MAG: DUF6125 family protein [Dehalococcoidales bacterium]|nr:DUF6125 family protein [Dehalococcoidales bacterium]